MSYLNLCFDECIYPDVWKISKVVPLSKNSKETLTRQNSRSIGILPVFSELLEDIMFKQVQHYFEVNYIYSEIQHTCMALAALTDDWLRMTDRKELVGAVFPDISAAFDIVDHELLIMKLSAYGFQQSAVNFMSSYLSNRKQCVMFNCFCSNV